MHSQTSGWVILAIRDRFSYAAAAVILALLVLLSLYCLHGRARLRCCLVMHSCPCGVLSDSPVLT